MDENFYSKPEKDKEPEQVSSGLELTPSIPEEEPDLSDELVLTPSLSCEEPESEDLVLEADDIFKAEEITLEGEEEAENRIEEAMSAYDKAMDQAAGLKK